MSFAKKEGAMTEQLNDHPCAMGTMFFIFNFIDLF